MQRTRWSWRIPQSRVIGWSSDRRSLNSRHKHPTIFVAKASVAQSKGTKLRLWLHVKVESKDSVAHDTWLEVLGHLPTDGAAIWGKNSAEYGVWVEAATPAGAKGRAIGMVREAISHVTDLRGRAHITHVEIVPRTPC